uniref:Transport membrane protein n=1 Tax=Viscum diospyrosicola TaxID=3234318 RepID=A0AB39A6M4_9MAGN
MVEVRIRSVRSWGCLVWTWLTRYWHREEFISPIAKPVYSRTAFSSFVLSKSTDGLPTAVETSPCAMVYFVFPLLVHQMWCFMVPLCFSGCRARSRRLLHLSVGRLMVFQFLTPTPLVPSCWHVPSVWANHLTTHSLQCMMLPSLSDHLHLAVRFSFLRSVSSQVVPGISICVSWPIVFAIDSRTRSSGLLVHLWELTALGRLRRFGLVLPLIPAATVTPPELVFQIVASSTSYSIFELAIYMASIAQQVVLMVRK